MPFTRKSKKRTKNYIKVVPGTKIPKFNTGDASGYNKGKYKALVSLIFLDEIQLRDNAIESARMELHKLLEGAMKGSYFLMVRAYPHHVLREHSIGSVAGSDRMTTGMAHSFGKSTGIAARIQKKGKLFSVACSEENVPKVRQSYNQVKAKLPGNKTVIVESINISNPSG